MPSYNEVRLYLHGLRLLIKGDARGLSSFDISDRNVVRSFGAFIYALPLLMLNVIGSRYAYVKDRGDSAESLGSFVLKSTLVDFADWFLPMAGLVLTAMLLGLRPLLRTLVVVWNWLTMSVFYIIVPLGFPMHFLPETEAGTWNDILTIGYLAGLLVLIATIIGAQWNVLRTIVGGDRLTRLALVASAILPAFLIEPLESWLGISTY